MTWNARDGHVGLAETTETDDDEDGDSIQAEYGEQIDAANRWGLYVKHSTVTAVGPDRIHPSIHTTGSPACLRRRGGDYQLSVDEVIERYVTHSNTDVEPQALHDKVEIILENIEPYKDEETLRDLYADEMSQAQIAHELDCSVHDVDKWMRKYGIHVGEHSADYSRHGETVGDKQTTASETDRHHPGDETILELHEDGLSAKEIAAEVDQPTHVIYIQLEQLKDDDETEYTLF